MLLIAPYLCLSQDLPKYLTLVAGDGLNGQTNLIVEAGFKVEIVGSLLRTGDHGPLDPSRPTDYSALMISTSQQSGYNIDMILTSKALIPTGLTFLGPASLGVISAGGPHEIAMVNLKITRIVETNSIPTNTVVIPTDATGPVNIILEQSEDLMNWTAANPGSYGASTPKRFFRVRAEKQ